MPATPSGADTLANTLLTSLTAGESFNIPDIDTGSDLYKQPAAAGALYTEINPLDVDALTSGDVGGTGVFDRLMTSAVNHLKVEYEAARISGAEYTKAYINTVSIAMQTAQQFLLTKDQAYWQAILAQQQARTAEIAATNARLELETTRVMLARAHFEAATAEVNYGLSKIKIANEDALYAQTVAETARITASTGLVEAQTSQAAAQTAGIIYTNTNILPAQLDGTQAQTSHVQAQTEGVSYTNANMLPSQKVGLDYTNANILPKQAKLLEEQAEVQRAQTLDTRSNAAPVTGLVGKQKDLYSQQITSYKRDAETKAVKMFTDAWITQKTIDEGLLAPTQFTNTEINEVLANLRTNLSI